MTVRIILRDEFKPFERRCALTPDVAKEMIDSGKYDFLVSTSKTRCYPDSEFEKAGCKIVPRLYWVTNPDNVDVVIGLKELPEPGEVIDGIEIPEKLVHTHIYFAHCFKGQTGWKSVMKRFIDGGGEIIDFEFLQYPGTRRRVCGMGKSAGFSGCGLGLLSYFGNVKPDTKLTGFGRQEFVDMINSEMKKNEETKRLTPPKVLILGYKGRVGGGCVALCQEAGIPESQMVLWDMEETRVGGPFIEMLTDIDVLCNCIYLTKKIPPFIDDKIIEEAKKKSEEGKVRLSVLVDISCDVTSENNPFPINKDITTFDKPIRILENGIKVIAIDHLPSLIPKEASDQFARGMMTALPYYVMKDGRKLDEGNEHKLEESVWNFSRKCFEDKKTELLQ